MSKRTDAIIADMTRQYKSTDEELREHQASLEQQMEANDEEIDRLKEEKKAIEKAKEKLEAEKQDEIKELTGYIDQMHSNFATMLKKTLEKMKDRIQRANAAWEEE